MDTRLVTAQCRTADFAAIEATLRDWPEVEAVGSFREKNNNQRDLTTVFVTFADAEQAAAASEKLNAIKGLMLEKGGKSGAKAPAKHPVQKRNKNLAAEVLKFSSYEERKLANEASRRPKRGCDTRNGPRGRERRGRGKGTSNNNATSGGNDRQRSGCGEHGARGGTGDRGRGGRYQEHPDSKGRACGRGRGYQTNSQRFPPMEANVAFADNIPFGTTNDRLMEVFSPYGRILDINRLELMAMVCYDNPESVQQCIQHVNGQKIGNNIITVSSGVVRIPGNIAMYFGM